MPSDIPRSAVYDYARVPDTFSYWVTAIYAERRVAELKERLVTEYSGYAVASALVAGGARKGLSFSAYCNPPLDAAAAAAEDAATPQQRAALRAYCFAYAPGDVVVLGALCVAAMRWRWGP
ncbi:hypothetical protein HXX76_013834 [Chlamydomonas incerta]|uniref:Uncharacterized protein n=1 Tax=Chlamydomonas incerta TaxID=51695 RepID=A0A835VTT1_CHLIN|nr:hypothetical protein HXX76_013834 [Chlamydomonas incerta]|eukprot:KAG2425249.1 hypothetical protein HXX76_013834 [Chlamydomonas incerta]